MRGLHTLWWADHVFSRTSFLPHLLLRWHPLTLYFLTIWQLSSPSPFPHFIIFWENMALCKILFSFFFPWCHEWYRLLLFRHWTCCIQNNSQGIFTDYKWVFRYVWRGNRMFSMSVLLLRTSRFYCGVTVLEWLVILCPYQVVIWTSCRQPEWVSYPPSQEPGRQDRNQRLKGLPGW